MANPAMSTTMPISPNGTTADEGINAQRMPPASCAGVGAVVEVAMARKLRYIAAHVHTKHTAESARHAAPR